MADYWKSQGRKFCDFCKCWIADNKPSIEFHEGGKKHKENVSKRLKEIHKNSAKQAKQNKKFEDDIRKMENAAMTAYLKDVENNTRDMTAERIIKEKLQKGDTKEIIPNPNRTPYAAPETAPRFKSKNQRGENIRFSHDIDPCDPTPRVGPPPHAKSHHHPPAENRSAGKGKSGKGKGKGKKVQEDNRRSQPVRKVWYEALSPEGYTYYWHIETNESVWEPPEEGYMTFAEQQEEAEEQAIQEKLLEQLEQEETVAQSELLEERRANAEREKMKELKERMIKSEMEEEDDEDNEERQDSAEENIEKKPLVKEEDRPYRRDYSLPEKVHPYGAWQTVKITERKPIDLQLPRSNKVQLPSFELAEPPGQGNPRTFKEKTVGQIDTGDSDDDGKPTSFKKRKISNKNVRKRVTDD